ncbi:hypothetical protein ILYODFUR_030520 [Ilyodon furcidens]|uniref:Uncharacterized protein n=1 Tax=Ilyodon furcidens TaxID=33524 RepID=A0ABV0TCM2_9TELE
MQKPYINQMGQPSPVYILRHLDSSSNERPDISSLQRRIKVMSYKIENGFTKKVTHQVMIQQYTDPQGVDFAAIPHTEHACSDSGEEKLPFNRKKPPAEPEPGSV